MKIIVDAMGGDHAPQAIVQGALDANRLHGIEIILVGRIAEILKAMENCGVKELPAGVEIKDAREVVEIADDPATAFKVKKDSLSPHRPTQSTSCSSGYSVSGSALGTKIFAIS